MLDKFHPSTPLRTTIVGGTCLSSLPDNCGKCIKRSDSSYLPPEGGFYIRQ
ncbi:MAG TPA: hypothetical protein VEC12_00570 [Bacteroidia bacterium]|nr:hypothetical protein [Bacteroidia bacterium]